MQLINNKLKKIPQDNFLSLPGEELLFLIRRHWIVIAPPLLFLGFFIAMIILVSYLLFTVFLDFPGLFLILSGIVLGGGISFAAKIIVDWYFHVYAITNRKILDLAFSPLFSHSINDVLLNQVRCTEVDVQINGIFAELFDVGDVIVTFDRPTHEEEFIFSDVKNPRWLGAALSECLDVMKMQSQSPNNQSWWATRGKDGRRVYRFRQEITPDDLGAN